MDVIDTAYVSFHMISIGMMAYCAAMFVFKRASHTYNRRPRRRAGRTYITPPAAIPRAADTVEERRVQRARRCRRTPTVTEGATVEAAVEGGGGTAEPASDLVMTLSVDELLCVVCMDSRRNVVLPCKHLATCMECTVSLLRLKTACPLCRSPFSRFTRVYTC